MFLISDSDVYVPNIFSPNGDNQNDRLLISASPLIDKISSFTIFDRWGNMVFSKNNFQPNDPAYAWDGMVKGKMMNSAVFAFKLIATLNDGSQLIRVGDVTLIR
jgi:gliding motility-associated-like protein